MSAIRLKELQTRRAKLAAMLETKKLELAEAKAAAMEVERKLLELEKQIRQATTEPTVSEHAILRYLERKLGIDIDAIKSEILSEETASNIKQLGSGKFPIGNGLRAVVKRNVVVSVID